MLNHKTEVVCLLSDTLRYNGLEKTGEVLSYRVYRKMPLLQSILLVLFQQKNPCLKVDPQFCDV